MVSVYDLSLHNGFLWSVWIKALLIICHPSKGLIGLYLIFIKLSFYVNLAYYLTSPRDQSRCKTTMNSFLGSLKVTYNVVVLLDWKTVLDLILHQFLSWDLNPETAGLQVHITSLVRSQLSISKLVKSFLLLLGFEAFQIVLIGCLGNKATQGFDCKKVC